MKRWVLLLLGLGSISNGYAQKPNWQGMDLKKDSLFGASTEIAYARLLQNKKWKDVIIAVIDMGIDTNHEDLKNSLWTNPKEIAGNGIDDDHNGYVDDMHGWNFSECVDCKQDVTLLATRDKKFFDSLSYSTIPEAYSASYLVNRRAIRENDAERAKVSKILLRLTFNAAVLDEILKKIGKSVPLVSDFCSYQTKDTVERLICNLVTQALCRYDDFIAYRRKNVEEPIGVLKYQVEHAMNTDDQTREEPTDAGNNDVTGPTLLLDESSSYHGSSVTGILAATRNNSFGIDGVADHVKIMSLRVVSFFQEMRDESLAKAIRYAVDNGARIINMSFGNSFSLCKKHVDEAVKYAMSKDVLIVKSAGNDGIDVDKQAQFPNRFFADSTGAAEAWITVAASTAKDDSSLVPPFSNYGKRSIDVFAPGVHLMSTFSGSTYGDATGTSVAAPVAAGIAALIMEYYPDLTAVQVKDIIMKSVVKRDILKDKCVSGGVVNAYNALLLAAQYAGVNAKHNKLKKQ